MNIELWYGTCEKKVGSEPCRAPARESWEFTREQARMYGRSLPREEWTQERRCDKGHTYYLNPQLPTPEKLAEPAGQGEQLEPQFCGTHPHFLMPCRKCAEVARADKSRRSRAQILRQYTVECPGCSGKFVRKPGGSALYCETCTPTQPQETSVGVEAVAG